MGPLLVPRGSARAVVRGACPPRTRAIAARPRAGDAVRAPRQVGWPAALGPGGPDGCPHPCPWPPRARPCGSGGGLEQPTTPASLDAPGVSVRLLRKTLADGTRTTVVRVGDEAEQQFARSLLAGATGRPHRRRGSNTPRPDEARPEGGSCLQLVRSRRTAQRTGTWCTCSWRCARSQECTSRSPADTSPRATGPQHTNAAYDLPQGWVVKRASRLQKVAVAPGNAKQSLCTVVVLAGTGGGWEANIKRWYAQMGASPSDDEVRKAVKRIRVAGVEAYAVTIRGRYRGMGDETKHDALLYGVVCPLEDGTRVRQDGRSRRGDGTRARGLRRLLRFAPRAHALRPRVSELAVPLRRGSALWSALRLPPCRACTGRAACSYRPRDR